MAAARSAPNTVRSELVVCCWTFRLSELAPHFRQGSLVDARDLQAGERRDARLRPYAEPIAALDQAEELIGASAAACRARLQAGDLDLPLELVARPGIAGQDVGVEAGLSERAIGRDADGVGPALAHEGVDPLRARAVAGGDADQEARIEAVVDAGGRTAEIVGERAGVAVARHRAEPAERARPYAERARPIARCDIAGLGERLALAAGRADARIGHLLAECGAGGGAVGTNGAQPVRGGAAVGSGRGRALRL